MATTTELEELIIKLTGENSGLQHTLADSLAKIQETATGAEAAAKRIEGFVPGLKALAVATAGYFAAVGLTDFLKDAFHQFAEAEAAELRLTAAIQSNGGSVRALLPTYRAFASYLQDVTTQEDDAVIALLAHVESLGLSGEAAERAVKNSVALAAAKGGEASSYIRLTAALEQGSATMLSRMLPSLRLIDGESEKVAEAQRLLAGMFSVAEAEASSSSGQLKKLAIAWGNVKEEAGAVVAEGIRPVVAALKDVVAWIQAVSPSLKAVFGGAVAVFTTVFGTIREKALEAWDWLYPVRQAVASLGQAIMDRLRDAWIAVRVAATIAWFEIRTAFKVAFAAMGVDVGDLRDAAVIGFLTVEFALRNLEKTGNLVWTGIQLGAVKLGDYLRYLFETVIPTYAKYAVGVMKDIAEGKEIRRLPELPAEQVSELQAKIKEQFEKLGAEAGIDLQTFIALKMAEFGKKPVDEAKKTGMDIGTGIGESAAKALDHFKAAAFGTAEALERIEDYRDRLAGIDRKAGKGDNRVAAAAFGAAEVGQRRDDRAVAKLDEILNELRKANQAPDVNLLPAGFANA